MKLFDNMQLALHRCYADCLRELNYWCNFVCVLDLDQYDVLNLKHSSA
jgi:hypothetical protein